MRWQVTLHTQESSESPHWQGAAPPAVFSLGNKKPRLVSIHAESTGVTRVFEVRPVLEGSGRDADPSQRQLLGPSVITKMIGPQRTGGRQRLQPVFCIVCQASMALYRRIRRRVTGSGGYGGNAQQVSAADAATAAIAHKRGQATIFHEN